MKNRSYAAALVALMALAGASVPVAAQETCSASGLSGYPKRPQTALAEPVQEMRASIVKAALNCNYDKLERLALRGKKHFTFSYGGQKDPSRYWRRLEADGYDPMAKLVKLFDARFTRGRVAYPDSEQGRKNFIWPSVFQPDPSKADWRSLKNTEAYSRKEIRQFKEYGQYIGYRMFISKKGDWTVFVSGD